MFRGAIGEGVWQGLERGSRKVEGLGGYVRGGMAGWVVSRHPSSRSTSAHVLALLAGADGGFEADGKLPPNASASRQTAVAHPTIAGHSRRR